MKWKRMVDREWPPCDICSEPVTTAEGAIWTNGTLAGQVARKTLEMEREHEGKPVLLSEIGDFPERVPWVWGHKNCEDTYDYWVGAERFATVGLAMDWTFHLMEKVWFQGTDWEAVVRRLHDIPRA